MNQADVKVSFYLKKSEADAKGNCPVMARLNVGKYSEAAFSVKMSVPHTMWHSGRATGKSVAAREINRQLDEIRASALHIYQEQSAIREGVTADDVKSLLLGMASGQQTVMSYFRTFIKNFEKRVGVNRVAGSLRAYKYAYMHVEKFLNEKYKLTDLPLRHWIVRLSRSMTFTYEPTYKSSRKRPSAIAFPISSLVAATIRTSATRSTLEPTGINVPSCNTRSNEDCISYGNVPISSRKSVPPLAASKQPPLSASAPVNAPFACPKNVEAASS